MSRVYAIANQKGGVSKTTTTRNLATALAARGRKVIVVDLDPQGALTLSFGVDPLKLKKHVYHMLMDDDVTLASVLQFHQQTGLGLVPANLDLAGAEAELIGDMTGNNLVLRSKLEPIRDKVDYILIDTPPSLGLLSVNALTAADGVIIPCQTQYLSYYGLVLLQRTIGKVQKRANPSLIIEAIIPTMYDSRSKHHQEVLGELRANYKDLLIDMPIPVRVALADAMVAGKSIQEYDARSDVAEIYRKIAEVVDARQQVK